jgi:hypothetical protein
VINRAKLRGDQRSEVKCREVNCGWMKGRPHDNMYFMTVTV